VYAPLAQCLDDFRVVVDAGDLYAVFGESTGGRQPDVSQSDHANVFEIHVCSFGTEIKLPDYATGYPACAVNDLVPGMSSRDRFGQL
jgi:hypothetical protein